MKQRAIWGAVYVAGMVLLTLAHPLSPLAILILIALAGRELWKQRRAPDNWRYGGIAYVALAAASLMTLIRLFGSDAGSFILLLLILIWISDSTAYLGGMLFGRTPFAPTISPKKTWEGFLIGWGMTLGFGSPIASRMLSGTWDNWYVLAPDAYSMIPLIVGGVAPMGDLVASAFKRKAGIKDSGRFLPGHGGFLDRLDSFLLVLIVINVVFWVLEML